VTGTLIASQLIAGITKGMLLFLIASGLTVIFGLLRVFNFAHGALYMAAAYVSYTVALQAADVGGFWVALVVVPVLVAGAGAVIERCLIRRVYGREFLLQVIVTYALAVIITESVTWVYGGNPRSLTAPLLFQATMTVGTVVIPAYHLWVTAVGVALAAAAWAFFRVTRVGWIIRAAVADRAMASALGINVDVLYTATFAVGVWLAAVAGTVSLPISAASPGMDVSMLIEAFTVVVIGGLGDIWGTLLAALLVGLIEAMGILWLPRGALAFLFVIMVVVLLVRPQGLFGKGSVDLK
jgi:branched-chain amino acid transport system permease protein